MRRFFLAILLCTTLASQAWGGNFPSFPTFPTFPGTPWWDTAALTFWAPFDAPADPLRLIKGTGSLSFTRATTATYVPANSTTGYIETAPFGTLRITEWGALIEGQRTNLALQSEALGNATNWVATTMTVDNNTAVAPDGATTAETLTATGANATLLQSYTGTAADYTASYYLKRKTGTGAVQVSADGTTWTSCTINASTWTRCADTRTVTVATYYHGIRLATSGDAVYAFGGDVELGTFASSYIGPTVAAAVTRNQDALLFPTSGNVSGVEGTMSAIIGVIAPGTTAAAGCVSVGTENAGYVLYVESILGGFTKRYDGTSVRIGNARPVYTGIKLVDNWSASAGTFRTSVNGSAIDSDIFDGDMNVETNGTIGGWWGASNYTWIKNLRIWNRSFSDSELQAITTP